jgi:hypothetical protein
MHRGCVKSFPISAKIARERSAWSAIDSNSDELLRVWRARDFVSVWANTTDSAALDEQAIDRTKKNERANIAASPQIRKVSPSRVICSANDWPVPNSIQQARGRSAGWQCAKSSSDASGQELRVVKIERAHQLGAIAVAYSASSPSRLAQYAAPYELNTFFKFAHASSIRMEPSVFNLEAGLCSKVNSGTELQHVEVRKVERSARRCALPSAAGFAKVELFPSDRL